MIREEFVRFLLVGCCNTLASYVVFVLLVGSTGPEVAYTAAYATGLGVAYVLGKCYVFKAPFSFRSLLQFPLVYVVQYVIGLGILKVVAEGFDLPYEFAILVSIVATIPLTFLLSRMVFSKHKRASDA
jgi:putative flippase GtrA